MGDQNEGHELDFSDDEEENTRHFDEEPTRPMIIIPLAI